MFRNFPARRSARQKWEAELVWFRLRYQDAAKATRCLNLLSRVEACGRLALYYLPGSPVSQLYLGVPEVRIRLVQQMASDFGLSVKPSLLDLCLPEARKLLPMADLPWERPFHAAPICSSGKFALHPGQSARIWCAAARCLPSQTW